jgi:carbon storage regulator
MDELFRRPWTANLFREDIMLVLTREEGQEIYIGKDIVVRVAEIGVGKVRIGITAPDGVEIWREEVFDRVLSQKIKKHKASLPP